MKHASTDPHGEHVPGLESRDKEADSLLSSHSMRVGGVSDLLSAGAEFSAAFGAPPLGGWRHEMETCPACFSDAFFWPTGCTKPKPFNPPCRELCCPTCGWRDGAICIHDRAVQLYPGRSGASLRRWGSSEDRSIDLTMSGSTGAASASTIDHRIPRNAPSSTDALRASRTTGKKRVSWEDRHPERGVAMLRRALQVAEGLQPRTTSFLHRSSEHPMVFERRCLPGASSEAGWLEVPVDTEAPLSPPFSTASRPRAATLNARMARSFSRAYSEPDEDAISLPVFTVQTGAPSASTLDGIGKALLPGGLQPKVIFDDTGRPIQWPWEAGAPCPIDAHQGKIAAGGGSDPVSAFFVRTTTAPPGFESSHSSDKLIGDSLKAATADGKGGDSSTGVNAWRAFCARHGRAAERPLDPNAPLWAKLDEEMWIMRFIADLVEDRDIKVSSARSYFSAASGWHNRKHGVPFAGGLDLKRLPEMVKGLRRLRGDTNVQLRRGTAPQKLREALDKLYPRNGTAFNANIRAMVSFAFQGLLRGREVCAADGKAWCGSTDLARGDIVAMLIDRVVAMIRPAKNMRYTKGKTVPIVVGAGGTYIDAHAELMELLRLDPVAAAAAEGTPMFRKSDGSAFSVAELRDIVKALMSAVGEDPSEFGAHSLRIGGASALFAAGAEPIHIKTMGRWSSDCYRLYVRACFEQTLAWTVKAGSQRVHDIVGERLANEVDVMTYGMEDLP